MFCYNCGTKLPEGAKFCFNCGTKVVDVSSTEASAAPPEPEPKREEPMPAAPIDDDEELDDDFDDDDDELDDELDDHVVHFTIAEEYEVNIPEGNALFKRMRAIFNFESCRRGVLVKRKIGDYLEADDLEDPDKFFDFATHLCVSSCDPLFDHAVDVLMQFGIDHITKSDLWDMADDTINDTDMAKAIAEDKAAIQDFRNAIASEEQANKANWQGGGFGIFGAIKGAVKAEIMNTAQDALSSLGRSITGNSYSARTKRFINDTITKRNYPSLAYSFIRNVCFFALFYKLYSTLLDDDCIPPITETPDKNEGRRINIMKRYENGRQTKEQTMDGFCRCLENPGSELAYGDMLRIFPEGAPDIFRIATFEGADLFTAKDILSRYEIDGEGLEGPGDAPEWTDDINMLFVDSPAVLASLLTMLEFLPEIYADEDDEGLTNIGLQSGTYWIPASVHDVKFWGIDDDVDVDLENPDTTDWAGHNVYFARLNFVGAAKEYVDKCKNDNERSALLSQLVNETENVLEQKKAEEETEQENLNADSQNETPADNDAENDNIAESAQGETPSASAPIDESAPTPQSELTPSASEATDSSISSGVAKVAGVAAVAAAALAAKEVTNAAASVGAAQAQVAASVSKPHDGTGENVSEKEAPLAAPTMSEATSETQSDAGEMKATDMTQSGAGEDKTSTTDVTPSVTDEAEAKDTFSSATSDATAATSEAKSAVQLSATAEDAVPTAAPDWAASADLATSAALPEQTTTTTTTDSTVPTDAAEQNDSMELADATEQAHAVEPTDVPAPTDEAEPTNAPTEADSPADDAEGGQITLPLTKDSFDEIIQSINITFPESYTYATRVPSAEKFQKKCHNAIKKYGHNYADGPSHVMMLHDDTTFGSGEAGYFLTRSGIVLPDKPFYIPYEAINDVSTKKDALIVNGVKIASKASDGSNLFERDVLTAIKNMVENEPIINALPLRRKRLLSILNDMGELPSGIYLADRPSPEKFNKKCINAAKSYGAGYIEYLDDVFLLYDDTLFGKGDEGYLITPTGIVLSEDPKFFKYDDIEEVSFDDSTLSINGTKSIHITSDETCEFTVNLIKRIIGG